MRKLSRCTCFHICMQAYISVYFISIVCVYEGTAMISGKRGQVVLTDGSDEEHLSKGVYDTYTKTNPRYSQVRSTMHVVCITQHIHTYTDIPRRHRWTCSKKETPKQISLHKLICTLPPVPSTTSNSLQRVCYCIEYFLCIYCIICMYCTYAFEFMFACMYV
jgi:hypothetical protein